MIQRATPDWSESELEGVSWRKSSRSGNANNCVEHASLPSGRQAVRDTKDRARGMLLFSADSWQGFLGGGLGGR
ncbi:DUF397 domain-containing protein [Streptomyces sp. NPDC049954]|uniref:DUF397 domain-containing protein n=1 Tax=Streptomyces sp. NPDC049954 TaxID=3155779 RepID=UPI00344681CC